MYYNYIMRNEMRNEMLKFEMRDLREFSEDDLVKMIGWDIGDWFEKIESGVYKIEVGSRGEIEDISKVEVIDGVFEVESKEEFMKRMLKEYELYKDGELINSEEIEEYREELDEWVYVEMFEGVVSMCESEENGYDIVKLVVD